MLKVGVVFGVKTRFAMAAKRWAPTPINTSGSSWAKCGSNATVLGKDFSSRSIRSLKIAAISLKARYCSSRAKSRSRASNKARSDSSSTSPDGSNLAAFKSKRVAATTKNSVVLSKSQPFSLFSNCFIYEMNSSVTVPSATSVISILCLEISCKSRSKGPSKFSRCRENPATRPSVIEGVAATCGVKISCDMRTRYFTHPCLCTCPTVGSGHGKKR